MIAKGKTAWMDLSLYQTRSSSYLSFLTFSWGIIADVDIESEAVRFLGSLRMDVWAVWRMLNLRKYKAKFSYLPPTKKKTEVVLPALDEPLPVDEGWVSIEDDFILFWVSQVTHAGEQYFHAPNCKIDDGIFNIFIVR
jgi:sphingosine kinase